VCWPSFAAFRTLAEEDIAATAAGVPQRPLAEAAGSECEELYSPGKAEAAGFGGPKSALYVVSKAGYFPDVCEGLAMKHLSRGDQVGLLGRGNDVHESLDPAQAWRLSLHNPIRLEQSQRVTR
jgi:hypothetical protein